MDSSMPMTLVGIPIFVTVALLFLLADWTYSIRCMALTDGLPWAGVRHEVFKMTRASIRQLKNSLQTIADGYAQYSRNGRAFLLPDISFKIQVLLPQEHIKWLTAQPDSILSVHKVREERNAFKYFFNNGDYKIRNKFVDTIIGRCLTKNLHYIQTDMYEEVRVSINDTMRLDEEWHEVNLQQAMKTVAERTGCRALFGVSRCRDPTFVQNVRCFSQLMGLGILIVGQTPWFLRLLISIIIRLPLEIYKTRALTTLVPLIQTRMQGYEQKNHTESLKDEEANDFVTQAVRVTMQNKDHIFVDDPHFLAEQFLILAFAAFSSNAAVGANIFLDILNTTPELGVYKTLREEAANVFRSEADWSDPAALQKLVLTDSVIRESMRKNPITARGLMREVMPGEGLVLPDGYKVIRGTWIGAPVHAVHMDERFYDRPDQYDSFRFARTGPGMDRLDAAQINDTFLAWGHGRSACPGRWFAIQELKLLIAYVTLNYEMERMEKRPRSIVLGDYNWPAPSVCIRVRRRKQE